MRKMMRKIAAFVACVGVASGAFGGEFAPKPFSAKIQSIAANNKTATITANYDVRRGSGGVVVRHFADGSSLIIAGVSVTASDQSRAQVRFNTFEMTAQDALPSIKTAPRVGDEVVLNINYNRAIAIVPNESAWNAARARFDDIAFVHPDVVAGEFYIDYTPRPERDDFARVCRQYAAGLALFALRDQFVFVDCQSFERVAAFAAQNSGAAAVPFYSNVKHIPAIFIDTDGKQIKDYEKYYKNLLNKKR